MRRSVLILTVIVAMLLLGGITAATTKSYPVAVVNWRIVPYYSFKASHDAALAYYGKALETYDRDQKPLLENEGMVKQIKATVLEKLIEDTLIDGELERRSSRKEIDQIIDKKIQAATAGADLKKEVETLYGLNLADFSNVILKPQAERETLEGRLLLENKKISDWLAEAKAKGNITILLSGFRWDGKGVTPVPD